MENLHRVDVKRDRYIEIFRNSRISILLTIATRLCNVYMEYIDRGSTTYTLCLFLWNCDPETRQQRKRDSGSEALRRELLYDFWANDLKRRIISERRQQLEFCETQLSAIISGKSKLVSSSRFRYKLCDHYRARNLCFKTCYPKKWYPENLRSISFLISY